MYKKRIGETKCVFLKYGKYCTNSTFCWNNRKKYGRKKIKCKYTKNFNKCPYIEKYLIKLKKRDYKAFKTIKTAITKKK